MSKLSVNTELSNVLSKQDALSLIEFIHTALCCRTENDFRQLIRKLINLLPHDYAVSGIASLDPQRNIMSYRIVNISYPDEWLDFYTCKQYHTIDPIVKSNFSSFGMQYWADTYMITPPAWDFLRHATDFGLKDGYTFGIKSSCGKVGSLFSISGESVEHNRRTELILEHAVPHFHKALIRIATPLKSVGDVILSHREQEVLEWIKNGKHTWEISTLLNVSENTIKFHVKNIFQKLDVVSRTQAVAVALEQGLISLD